MAPETRDALLFSQMQEGLRHWPMESPAVSETTSLPVFALYQRVRSGGFEEASIVPMTTFQHTVFLESQQPSYHMLEKHSTPWTFSEEKNIAMQFILELNKFVFRASRQNSTSHFFIAVIHIPFNFS